MMTIENDFHFLPYTLDFRDTIFRTPVTIFTSRGGWMRSDRIIQFKPQHIKT